MSSVDVSLHRTEHAVIGNYAGGWQVVTCHSALRSSAGNVSSLWRR